MTKRQRFLTVIAIASLMVSVVGITILAVINDSSTQNLSSDEADSEQLDEINSQLAQQQAEQERLQQEEAERRLCATASMTNHESAGKSEVPDFALPEGDVTELQAETLTEGNGAVASSDSCIIAYYHGVLATDGTVFDSAYERNAPHRFSLRNVISGWQEGIDGMKEGEVRVLTIPSDKAYGASGSAPLIGPNADLVFVVELVEVVE